MDWRATRDWLRRALDLDPHPPGWAHDPVHGPVLVTPVHPDRASAPYRVESPTLGVLELVDEARVVRTPDFVGQVRRPGGRTMRRSTDDVRVAWDGHELRLRHTGNTKARLDLDGTTVARLVRTGLSARRDDRSRTSYDVQWERPVPGSVALLGHALASRYGVGADGTVSRFVDEVS